MSQVGFDILGRAIPAIRPVYEGPAQVFPVGSEAAVGCTIIRAAIRVDRDQPWRDVRTGWAGGMKIGRNFDSDFDGLTFEPPSGNGVGEGDPVVVQILGSVAEFLQSCRERFLTKDGHVRKPASGRQAW